ncbi:D-alanyl-D-alanine carboxypeptidase [Streptomyces sp. NBC_00257]|uniref:D-alanyl-D-alanine carboxypeptidase family protein n=1 Tax=unclassified Streptomyces TaxID=2593676 RepID=UPI002254B6FB|nr:MULTISPECIES: D-alanyl-D-alanine carboxypeptidase [unclassified Streptomyces]MCX4866484.1 D-alanyl-D-alanine carboxypeptidase [Streptomyces sp. NBC_00906]MCX4897722.1 D-alanyl-D-alanine carboxypeptidase [Streptomyces sp. NBC_00892]MCX5431020.1 D-alanyl-D-alanine carboxypeptidase [Streptomyces sp. NBC_00062]
MAGESPDKSEQQKSSGTARSESDPRLAVFREPSADDAAAGNGSGKTDTATAVFRTDALAVAGEAGSDTATAVFRAPSEDGENGDGADGAVADDAEADAASVASAAEDSESTDGAVGAEETGEDAGAKKPADAPEEAPEASEDADAAEAADAPETAEAAEAAEEPEKPEGDADDAGDAAETAESSESPEGTEGAAEGDARLRAAVAAWVSKDDDEAAEGEDTAKAPEGDDVTPETATASAGADADAESKADDDADEPSGDESDDESGDDKASSDEEKKADAEDDKDADAAEDKGGIDQPTAIFRAPAAPKVDQPTTALKILPSESKSEPKAESAAERTSKFVPLRGDDARPAPKPAPAPRKPETPVAPTPASLSGAERTTQQPMPPKPPLDLLAELTNTPPPPETPVRTAVRRVKIWTPLVLLLLIVFAIAQAVRPLPTPTLALSADPTYTFGGGKLEMPWPGEGQGAVEVEGVGSLGTYGNQKPAPIASVAKIMTAYVILQDHPITGKQNGGLIEVDKKAGEEANRPDESTAPIQEGQKYTQRQMLQLLMIPSGNNVARLLARWDAKTEEAFVERMNAAAKDLGMTDSTYTDPSGLEPTTRSTPADQLELAKAVMQNDVFREIVNMPQADIPGIGKTIYNNNVILLEPGVSGIKTGSSTPAGGNLVWAADTVIDGKSRRIVGAVMGAQLDGTLDAKLQRAIQNSLKLIKAAQKGVVSAPVVKKGDVVGYVDNGLGGRTPVVSTKDLKAIGWGGLTVSLKIGAGDKPIPHSAKAGTTVGEVTVGTGTGKVSAPVTLQSEMTEPTFGDKLTRIG